MKTKVWKPAAVKIPLTTGQGRRPYLPLARPVAAGSGEGLTGQVQGKQASDIEERFARGLSKNSQVLSFEFRTLYFSPAGVGGGAELDFLVRAGINWGVQTDGAFSHKSAEQRAHDVLQDARLSDYLLGAGIIDQPIVRVPGDRLQTQADADATVKGMF